MTIYIHDTAEVSSESTLGDGTKVWNFVQIRENVSIGKLCVLGRGVYVDQKVIIGNYVKIQNNASIFHGVTIEDGVFIGPHVCFTNDLYPRAVNSDFSPKMPSDWMIMPTLVCAGAAIGANSTIRCGVKIGKWAMVGAGSMVVEDVPDYGLVYGVPARMQGYACECGTRMEEGGKCEDCGFILI